MRVAIAGGGTGGHLFPALAVAEALAARGHETLVFISEKEIDRLATGGRSDLRFESLPGIGLPNPFSPAIFRFLSRSAAGFAKCRRIYAAFKPDAVLGMGGFTCTTPIVAARLRNTPAFLHESNAIPGKANRFNARFCHTIFLGLADCEPHFPHRRRQVTGTPVRTSLRDPVPRETALRELDLDPDPGRATLLVMGGSQGARGINRAVANAAPELADLPLQIIHLTGSADEAAARDAYARARIRSHVAPFCQRMELPYSAADLAVARSGAASLTELSLFGLPSILIPYPHAAEDHQTRNAEVFARHRAATLLKETDAASRLAREIRDLLANPARTRDMAGRARSLAVPDAATRVAAAIEQLTA